jgi:catechol 2,3-dioxygenase-like lactoylglutathione lyase family enzyme
LAGSEKASERKVGEGRPSSRKENQDCSIALQFCTCLLEFYMLGSTNIVAFVPTRDSGTARAFYEGLLGLKFIKDDGFAMVLEANGILIRVAKAGDFTPAPFTILGWQVTGIEKIVAALRDKGVAFEVFGFLTQDELGIWTAPTGDKVAWFKDPDGNMLSLSQHV